MYQMAVPALDGAALSIASRKSTSLSARQLLDIELGLFLLSQLLPTAPPDALPDLLIDDSAMFSERSTWTARQHRYLNRARLLLGHFRERSQWLCQIERYANGSAFRQAYAISADRRCFGEKSIGFFRNRAVVLRQMLG